MIFYQSYVLNLYTLFLLLILFFTMTLKKETYRYSSRLLRGVIVLISIQLVVEIFSWGFDTINEPYARFFNYLFNYLFFLIGPMIVAGFSCYVDYLTFKSKERLERRHHYMHLFVIFVILAIINLFTPIIFSISSDNVYQRELFMNFAFIAVFLKLLYVLYMAWKNKHRLEKNVFISICIFGLIPLVGGLIQLINFGLLVMWAFVGLSVVIAYIFTETINSSKDFLTKLYTRELAEEYISQLLETHENITVIILDLDNLKVFNDQYGHKEGDMVLITFADALCQVFPKYSLISRYGGDEFLVVLKNEDADKYLSAIEKLNNLLALKSSKDMQIKYSFGMATTKDSGYNDLYSLLHQCDIAMYKQKASHKADTKKSFSKHS